MENLHDRIIRYMTNPYYWNEDDFELYNKLNISLPMIGPERKKWNEFYNNIKKKLINS